MRLSDALTGIQRVGIDTSPLIYFVEKNAAYVDVTRAIIQRLQSGEIEGFTSTITLVEVLNIAHSSQ